MAMLPDIINPQQRLRAIPRPKVHFALSTSPSFMADGEVLAVRDPRDYVPTIPYLSPPPSRSGSKNSFMAPGEIMPYSGKVFDSPILKPRATSPGKVLVDRKTGAVRRIVDPFSASKVKLSVPSYDANNKSSSSVASSVTSVITPIRTALPRPASNSRIPAPVATKVGAAERQKNNIGGKAPIAFAPLKDEESTKPERAALLAFVPMKDEGGTKPQRALVRPPTPPLAAITPGSIGASHNFGAPPIHTVSLQTLSSMSSCGSAAPIEKVNVEIDSRSPTPVEFGIATIDECLADVNASRAWRYEGQMRIDPDLRDYFNFLARQDRERINAQKELKRRGDADEAHRRENPRLYEADNYSDIAQCCDEINENDANDANDGSGYTPSLPSVNTTSESMESIPDDESLAEATIGQVVALPAWLEEAMTPGALAKARATLAAVDAAVARERRAAVEAVLSREDSYLHPSLLASDVATWTHIPHTPAKPETGIESNMFSKWCSNIGRKVRGLFKRKTLA